MLFMTIAVHLGIDPHLKYISEGKPTLSGFFYVGLVGLVGPTVPNTNPGSRLLSFAKCNWRRKNRVAQPVIDMRPMSQPHVAACTISPTLLVVPGVGAGVLSAITATSAFSI